MCISLILYVKPSLHVHERNYSSLSFSFCIPIVQSSFLPLLTIYPQSTLCYLSFAFFAPSLLVLVCILSPGFIYMVLWNSFMACCCVISFNFVQNLLTPSQFFRLGELHVKWFLVPIPSACSISAANAVNGGLWSSLTSVKSFDAFVNLPGLLSLSPQQLSPRCSWN